LGVKSIEMLVVVALLQNLPEHGLVRGQAGTVVEALASDLDEVEFCDDDGRTCAIDSFRTYQIMRLYHEPISQTT
jgi:hypothetical protein